MVKNPGKVHNVAIYPKQKKDSGKSPIKNKHSKKQNSDVKMEQPKPEHLHFPSESADIPKKHVSDKRREKRANLKAQSKDQVVENATCLLLLNLPQSVNYNMLKNTITTASRMEIYKKGSKRHAFVNFESHKLCKKAMEALQGFTLDDREIVVKYVSRQPQTGKSSDTEQRAPASIDKCITLSNLPFTITKPELEEEFPTASEVVMNVNKNGRFRGSCLLRFESTDDCKIVWDACRGRKVGGRLVQCRAGAWFEQTKANQSWGVKLAGLPVEVTNRQLAALFPKESLVKAHCDLNAEGSFKTGLVRFTNAEAQRDALRMFNKKEFFGVRVRCRPWVPQKSRSKPRLLTDGQTPTPVEDNPAPTKSKSAPPENEIVTKKSPASEIKQKRKRHSMAEEGAELPILTTPPKKKRCHEQIDA